MTTTTDKKRRGQLREPKPMKQAPFPVWSPVLIMLAVIITGIVLGTDAQAVTKSFFVIFAVVAIVTTVLVEARGLFLTVASLPLYFVAGTVIVGWISTPKHPGSGRRTLIINAMYPAVSHFLWLIFPFLACVVIALVRWWLYREELARHLAYQEHMRRRRAARERSNLSSYARVRAGRAAADEDSARTDKDSPERSATSSTSRESRSSSESTRSTSSPRWTEVPKTPTPSGSRSSDDKRSSAEERNSVDRAQRTWSTPTTTPRLQRREPLQRREHIQRRSLKDLGKHQDVDGFRLEED
ncbi:hypothetical protein F7230_02600 [Corynebacterium sp. 320]|uniref:DUF6542 domain-containing protein n=1 Tax=Corynebacterium zhongnanshanii TaxID=2768834 RepID=A0ABQ6VFE6_9CORY|nr:MULTISPECIES: DUF6542 domain-containing protein [Corynebacterium]KAB1504014.1 hypothetical protein F7230_02600 [Corynebacterium sp. 320]KAB1552887.1 hypothetical protein F7233_03995 [Corynebacterium sp. 321]KAB1553895.1 hypothetical protein F7232_02590 [Corynebacterium sp. 319]KAB3523137.1 hypothetical protein F8377_03045 [Corynebacterium zhongnanshanii]KAB3528150.1 hypothetical protein F8354_02600 [Corynebacterium sp. 250]